MKFTWDEEKRIRNLEKHGLDFPDAYKVFKEPVFTFEDIRFDYGEQRLVSLGILNGMTCVIVHTETVDEIRVISLRKATKNEEKIYFRNIHG